jgi:hypothetical protein
MNGGHKADMESMRGHEDGELRSTDDVLSESVQRVRSSRQLIDEIDQRLARTQHLVADDDDDAARR